jgi:hypothetical protein
LDTIFALQIIGKEACPVFQYHEALGEISSHSEPAHTPVHHQGWMICDQETIFCWVPVP